MVHGLFNCPDGVCLTCRWTGGGGTDPLLLRLIVVTIQKPITCQVFDITLWLSVRAFNVRPAPSSLLRWTWLKIAIRLTL